MIVARLSGGAANADPALALGGAMSGLEYAGGESASYADSAISGVAITGSSGNAPDGGAGPLAASLSFAVNPQSSIPELIFTPYGTAPGTIATGGHNYTAVLADGDYQLSYPERGASLKVSIVTELLPTQAVVAPLAVSRIEAGLFTGITPQDAQAGAVAHRCLYLLNAGLEEAAVSVWVSRQPSASELALSVGTPGSTAPSIPSEDTAPAGAEFQRPSGAAPITLTLAPAESAPLWLRRTARASHLGGAGSDGFTVLVREERE